MSTNNLVVISFSDRPLGLSRMFPDFPVIPLECVRDNLDLLIGENRMHQKEFGTGRLVGYIQDAHAALDIIDHALFLYVETPLSYRAFLNEYATIPEICPVCFEVMDFLDIEERLEHIIRCRWNSTRAIIAVAAKAIEQPRFLH